MAKITSCPACGAPLTLDHSRDASANWSGYVCPTKPCRYYGMEAADIERLEARRLRSESQKAGVEIMWEMGF